MRAQAQRATKLLLVHGRGQQGLNPDTLKSQWMATLGRGAAGIGATVPADLDVALPFYGDKLDEFTRVFDLPLTSDARPRGGALDNEFPGVSSRVRRSGAGASGRHPGAGRRRVWRQSAGARAAELGMGASHPAILRAIDKYGGGMNQTTLELFTRDVFLYTTKAGVRDEIDAVVAAKLTEQPTVVVGHSLGSVVAYSVLRSDRRALRVPLFVTLGSPLGVRGVRDQFRPLRSPKAVSAWYNAYDTRDVVALYPLDADNFPVEPAIANYGKVRNSTDNRHGIAVSVTPSALLT